MGGVVTGGRDSQVNSAARVARVVARREVRAAVRSRALLVGTALSIVVLAGLILAAGQGNTNTDHGRVGFTGQATALAEQLADAVKRTGQRVEVVEVTDAGSGKAAVARGGLDALISGTPANLTVLVKHELSPDLLAILNGLARQQVLLAQLASVDVGSSPQEILDAVAGATVDVHALARPQPWRDRLPEAGVIVVLVAIVLLWQGLLVAGGVREDRSSRVLDFLLMAGRPEWLAAGRLLGLGVVGLAQLAIVGVVGGVLASATGASSLSAAGLALVAGLLWYPFGYALYGTAFAAAESLPDSRRSTTGLASVAVLPVLAAGLGLGLLPASPSGTASTVLSLLPPFAPVLMPGRLALGAVPAWQVGIALVLAVLTVLLLATLGRRRLSGQTLS